mmetsp:Transcript_17354/g.50449  ORF Transcript_17354/g.50449 Transcript_17354/m.50449 type:complete len:340 (+) Transcript_17354:1160-2179(+)
MRGAGEALRVRALDALLSGHERSCLDERDFVEDDAAIAVVDGTLRLGAALALRPACAHAENHVAPPHRGVVAPALARLGTCQDRARPLARRHVEDVRSAEQLALPRLPAKEEEPRPDGSEGVTPARPGHSGTLRREEGDTLPRHHARLQEEEVAEDRGLVGPPEAPPKEKELGRARSHRVAAARGRRVALHLHHGPRLLLHVQGPEHAIHVRIGLAARPVPGRGVAHRVQHQRCGGELLALVADDKGSTVQEEAAAEERAGVLGPRRGALRRRGRKLALERKLAETQVWRMHRPGHVQLVAEEEGVGWRELKCHEALRGHRFGRGRRPVNVARSQPFEA